MQKRKNASKESETQFVVAGHTLQRVIGKKMSESEISDRVSVLADAQAFPARWIFPTAHGCVPCGVKCAAVELMGETEKIIKQGDCLRRSLKQRLMPLAFSEKPEDVVTTETICFEAEVHGYDLVRLAHQWHDAIDETKNKADCFVSALMVEVEEGKILISSIVDPKLTKNIEAWKDCVQMLTGLLGVSAHFSTVYLTYLYDK